MIHAGLLTTAITLSFLTKPRPIPPPSTIQSLVWVYKERIASQPLPLFDTATLSHLVLKFSQALLYSFLALTVRFSDDAFFQNCRCQAVNFYKNSARVLLFSQIAEPTGSLELIQSFCLLCLNEIEGLSRVLELAVWLYG